MSICFNHALFFVYIITCGVLLSSLGLLSLLSTNQSSLEFCTSTALDRGFNYMYTIDQAVASLR